MADAALSLDLAALNARAQGWSPQQILAFALTRFEGRGQSGDKLVISSSFSAEDNVVVDIATRISRRFRVITLDTGRLPEETHAVLDEVRTRYRVRIDTFFPKHEAVEELVRIKGTQSFRSSMAARKECCSIRKLEPQSRALVGVDAWATGLRQAQSMTRAGVAPFEHDGDRVKVNPLWRFSDADLWRYVKEHNVPVSALYARGYTSIGCAPCTRAVTPEQASIDPRAGRWWWEAVEHKECGLHTGGPRV
jgi:phosphoadenosine phosphosulfate reductase